MTTREPRRRRDPEDRSVRRTWWLLSATFLVLAAVIGIRALTSADSWRWLPVVAIALSVVAAIAHRNAVVELEARGRAEAENFARILSGLSRSVSVDAIVRAIVDDLADGMSADHVVIARRRPDGGGLEATLVTRRAGVPNSSTVLPIGDLDLDVDALPVFPVGIPIETEPDRPLVATASATRGLGAASPIAERKPVAIMPGRPGREPDWRESAVARAAGSAASEARGRAADWLGELMEDFGLRARDRNRRFARRPQAEVLGTGPASQSAARIAERVRAVYGLSHTLAAPMRSNGEVFGAIVVSRRDREPWDLAARRLLEGAAVEASAALARAYSFREATAHAATDPLTGLPNRRYFDEFCGLLARRRRAGDAVAVLMVDIDKFKGLNDKYGHPEGDEVLRAVSRAIVSAVREEDVPARVGGEEFAVLLRNPGPDVAVEVGERVCDAVRALDLSAFGIPGVSVSVGVASAEGADEPIPSIIERADRALLRAKRSGRDRVIAA
ncbi:MAG: GGDEF domain-containing protein [Candidatus Limnocylindrales bacterium]